MLPMVSRDRLLQAPACPTPGTRLTWFWCDKVHTDLEKCSRQCLLLTRPLWCRVAAGWRPPSLTGAGFAHGGFSILNRATKGFVFHADRYGWVWGPRRGGHLIRPEDSRSRLRRRATSEALGLAFAPSRRFQLSGPPDTGLGDPPNRLQFSDFKELAIRCIT